MHTYPASPQSSPLPSLAEKFKSVHAGTFALRTEQASKQTRREYKLTTLLNPQYRLIYHLRTEIFAFALVPDVPVPGPAFFNLRASRSVDQRNLCSSETSIDGFYGSKVEKCSVGWPCLCDIFTYIYTSEENAESAIKMLPEKTTDRERRAAVGIKKY